MSEEKDIAQTPQGGSFKMLRAMVGIGAACALLIVFTFEASQPRIKKLKKEALEKAITKVVPGITESIPFKVNDDGTFTRFEGEANGEQLIYAGYNEKKELQGIAIEAAGQGYADIIRILYGFNPEDQTVIGFYVLESKETPGLGDKIEKDETFLANFEKLDVSLDDSGETLSNEVVTVKDGQKVNPWEVNGITGATISSRAIGDILNKSTQQMVPMIIKNLETFNNGDEN